MVVILVFKTVNKKRVKVIVNNPDNEYKLLQVNQELIQEVQEKEGLIKSLERDKFLLEKELFNMEGKLNDKTIH